MEIKIVGEAENLKVVDYIIREMDLDLDGEQVIKRPHFQAKIQIKDSDSSLDYSCDISYYGEDGKFVGLDETYVNLTCNKQNTPSSFSTALNIPEPATKMVVTFTSEKEKEWVNIAIGVAVICVLVVLGAWAADSVINLFKG